MLRTLVPDLIYNSNLPSIRIDYKIYDTRLWELSTRLQPNRDFVLKYRESLMDLLSRFSNNLQSRLQRLRQQDSTTFFWHPQVSHCIAGSVGNETHITGFDLDIIIILNTKEPLQFHQQPSPHLTDLAADDQIVSESAVHLLVRAVRDSLAACIQEQATAVLSYNCGLDTAPCWFTIKHQAAGLQWDVLPALVTSSSDYCLLTGSNGAITRSETNIAAARLQMLDSEYKGMRELIRLLKLLAKTQSIVQPELLDNLPSCAFDAAVQHMVTNTVRTAWKKKGFTEIFGEIMQLLRRCNTGTEALCSPTATTRQLFPKGRDAKSVGTVDQFLAQWHTSSPDSLWAQLSAHVATLPGIPPSLLSHPAPAAATAASELDTGIYHTVCYCIH